MYSIVGVDSSFFCWRIRWIRMLVWLLVFPISQVIDEDEDMWLAYVAELLSQTEKREKKADVNQKQSLGCDN